MNLTVTIDNEYNNSVNCPPSNNNNDTVVVVGTNGTGGANGKRQVDTLDTIILQSVPSSLTSNSWIYDPSSSAYISAYIATPAVSIALGSGPLDGYANLSFPHARKPDPSNNLCVAILNVTSKIWSCEADSITSGTTVSAEVNTFGVFAVVVQPSCIVSGSESGASFCSRQTWDAGSIGYFCANGGHSFYMCWDAPSTWASSLQSCPTGTSCSCCSSTECSNHNLESPCR
jgi:hypothetical protein